MMKTKEMLQNKPDEGVLQYAFLDAVLFPVQKLKQPPRFSGKFLLVEEDSRLFNSKMLNKPFSSKNTFPSSPLQDM